MEEKERKELRRNDLVASLILLGVAGGMFAQSIRMTFFVELPGVRRVGWFVAPGVFPLLLTSGLIAMAISILVTALRESGGLKGEYLKSVLTFLRSSDFRILFMEAGLLLLYVFAFLRNLPFVVATALYLFLAMAVVKAARWYVMVIIAVVIAWAVGYLFGTLFRVPLP